MALYYFDLHECGSVTRDPEGREFATLAEAQASAVKDARAIMCAELTDGALCLSCHIAIRSGDDRPLGVIRFRDAVAMVGG